MGASPWQEMFRSGQELSQLSRSTDRAPKVLCATSVGGHGVVRVVDSLVAVGLWLRGAEPHVLLCDHALPACESATYSNFPSPHDFVREGPRARLCEGCFREGEEFFRPLPFPLHRYTDYLDPDVLTPLLEPVQEMAANDCFSYISDGMALGEQARAGLIRFLGKASFEDEDPSLVQGIARRYLIGAIVAAHVARNAIERIRPDVLVCHHGVYVPQGVMGLVARKLGVRTVHWATSYRNTTVIYSHHDTYHRTFLSEPVASWRNRVLSEQENKLLSEYLNERRGGGGDWSWLTPDRGENVLVDDARRLAQELSLDPGKPIFGLLTNVLWDAQLYYANLAFPEMLSWLFTTMDFFIAHPELQLIIRVHPHEVKPGNRQPTGPEIAKRYPQLPPNIKLIDRDSPYSTYALMDLCRAVLIYGTKTGVELAPFGMPVVTAGDAWIRGKGLTMDPESHDEYIQILNDLPKVQPLDSLSREYARRYAYHYFFRRMIPLSSLDPGAGFPPRYKFTRPEELLPGNDRGLDTVCEGIISGKEFIFDS